LDGLFERKDEKRIFSAEQRRLLWNSEEKKKCALCDEQLDWTNFQVDHIKAYSKGGKTELSNAALTCGPCNASKGAGRKTSRRA
jgi:5-methylcytosine-specific restriction endonuclease McrA